jgi:hypothetical protein
MVLSKERRRRPPTGLLRPPDRGGAIEWGYGLVEKEKKRLRDLLDSIALLRSDNVHGAGVIRVYHVRGLAPLMARTLPLYEMTPDALLEGTVLARGPFCNSEI